MMENDVFAQAVGLMKTHGVAMKATASASSVAAVPFAHSRNDKGIAKAIDTPFGQSFLTQRTT
jgi:hypothetical protein